MNVSPESPDAYSERVQSLSKDMTSSATTDQSGILNVPFTDGHHFAAPDANDEVWCLAVPVAARSSACLGGKLSICRRGPLIIGSSAMAADGSDLP